MSATQTRPETAAERVSRLEERLQDGFLRIGAKLAEGIDVTNWTDYWCELLAEYVALNDEIAAFQPEQIDMAGMPRTERAA
jgi:hypothetical protein